MRPNRLARWLAESPPLRTGSTLLRVGRDEDGQWAVTEPGSDRALARLATADRATIVASWALGDNRGGNVEVSHDDGSLLHLSVLKAGRSWWQLTGRPLTATILGLFWLSTFALRVVDDGQPGRHVLQQVLLGANAVLAIYFLLSAVLMYRRRQRLPTGTTTSNETSCAHEEPPTTP